MTPHEKKEAYRAKCQAVETARRKVLGLTCFAYHPVRTKRRVAAPHRPAYGSQEWAETYSDDLGDSHD